MGMLAIREEGEEGRGEGRKEERKEGRNEVGREGWTGRKQGFVEKS